MAGLRARSVLVAAAVVAASAVAGPVAAKPSSTGGNVNVRIEGYDVLGTPTWTPGNTAGYAELDKIPFRLVLSNSGTPSTVDLVETVFDHERDGIPGIEDLDDFALCGAPTSSAAGPPGGAAPCSPVPVFATQPSSPPTTPYVVGPTFRTGSGGVVQGVYTWRNIPLAANQVRTMTWTALLALGSHAYNGSALHMQIGAARVNGATVSFGAKDVPIPVNQIIATATDKKVNGSDTPAAVAQGDVVTVTITASTFGPRSGTQDIVITDELPACMGYVAGSATPTPTSVTTGTDGVTRIVWSFADVPNRTSRTVSFRATALTPGTCRNVAITTSDLAPPTRDEVPTPITGAADVAVTKACPDTAAPNSVITCVLSYRNEGNETAANVTLTDVLGPGLTYVATTSGPSPTVQNNTPSAGSTTLLFSVGTLTPGQAGTISYQVRVPATGPAGTSTFGNTVTIRTTSTERDTSDNTDSEQVTVAYAVNLALTKTCPATVPIGSTVTHTLGYRNNGTATATGTRIVDTLPSGLTYVRTTSGPTPTVSSDGRTLTFTIGSVAPNGSGSITYEVRATAGGTQTDSATVSSDQTDSDTSDNTATCTSGVSVIDVLITKDCPTTAQPGATLVHTLRYRNAGNTSASGVVITDTLGAGLTYVRTTSGPTPTVSSDGRTLTFTVGTLAPSTTASVITYEVRVPATTNTPGTSTQTFTDQATISTTSTDADTSNNTSQECPTQVTYSPTLTLTKTSCATSAPTGGLLGYTLTAANTGTAPATQAVLTDAVPTGTSAASHPGGTLSTDGRTVTWSLGTLDPSETEVRTLTVLVTAGDGSPLVNVARLTSPDVTGAVTSTVQGSVSNAGAATSGSAYVLDLQLNGSAVLLDEVGSASSSAPAPGPAAAAETVVPLAVPNVLTADLVTASSRSSVTGGQAVTTATAEVANLNALAGAITADVVKGVSQSVAGPFGATYSSAGSTFENLVIRGEDGPVVLDDAAPGTVVQVDDPLMLGFQQLAVATLYGESGSSSLAPRPNASHSVNMLRVELLKPFLTLPAGAVLTVSHAESRATYPSGDPCGALGTDTVSGRAYTAFARNALLGSVLVGEAVLPATGGAASRQAAAAVPGVVTSTTGSNTTSGSLTPSPASTANSHVENVSILDGLITARVLDVTSTSRAGGGSASTDYATTFLGLVIDGEPVLDESPEPNTPIAVPQEDGCLLLVILNEQVTNSDGIDDTEGTVNAIHAFVLCGTQVETEVIVASAHSDAHDR